MRRGARSICSTYCEVLATSESAPLSNAPGDARRLATREANDGWAPRSRVVTVQVTELSRWGVACSDTMSSTFAVREIVLIVRVVPRSWRTESAGISK